ncbi:MAG: GTP-binding protein [Pirellulaceae bacterium]
MAKTRLVLLGGFLGAGKTTTIARLAHTYQQRDQRVVIVTNDQASDLVDTHLLRSQGLHVAEVAGGCFCCRFDELISVIEKLGEAQAPDVILAEPVGSCTDLVATVIQPLRQIYEDQFEVAPYGVLLKPKHGRRILANEPQGGFSPKAAYLFEKQLEEADFIVINRIDELAPAEVRDLVALVQQRYPDVPVVRMSARTGEGCDALLKTLDQKGEFGLRVLELDYDVYAEGEAELGWLNTRLTVTSEQPFSLDSLLVDIVQRIRTSLAEVPAETAHLKTMGIGGGHHGVANLISSDAEAELSLPSDCHTSSAEVIVNARVAVDPEILGNHVRAAVNDSARLINAEVTLETAQQFRPGRPEPTHRFAIETISMKNDGHADST